MNLFAQACVEPNVSIPSRSYRFHLPPSMQMRATQLSRPDAVVWLGTLAIALSLFVIFFVL